MSEKMALAEFLHTLKVARKRYAQMVTEWDENVEMHAAEGHRPSTCIHGTNMWTDYDNICGACEEGLGLRRMAVESAYRDVHKFWGGMAWITEGYAQGFISWEQKANMIDEHVSEMTRRGI